MKKLIIFLTLSMVLCGASAQDVTSTTSPRIIPASSQPLHFGYFSYREAFETMPGYAAVQDRLKNLRKEYDDEMKRVEEEFNLKYEQFLEGKRDFAASIFKKRLAEVQDLMEKNMAFKQEAKRLLQKAEDEAYQPLRERLNQAILTVGKEKGLAFIINTDDNALPYINPAAGENVITDIQALIR